MINAQEPPELPPMVARPSGSLVSFTCAFASTSGSTSCLDELGILAGHGVVFQAALAALGVAAAIADGDGNHHRHLVFGDQVVERGEQRAVGAVRADDEGRDGAGNVLLSERRRRRGAYTARDGWW